MKRILSILIILATLAGCCEEETCDAESEVVIEVLIPENAEDAQDSELPDSLIVDIDGEEYEVEPGETVTVEDGLAPGEYTYYIYSSSQLLDQAYVGYNAGLETYIALVNLEDGYLVANPNTLYFGTERVEVAANGVTVIKMDYSPITCDLHFKLELIGDAVDRLVDVSAQLDGVAQRWDCIGNVPYGASASIIPTLARTTATALSISRSDDTESHYLEGTVHILGVSTSDTQLLTLELTYEDLYPETYSYTSDVSALLADFNDDKSTSTTLTNTIETPTEANLEGAIGDWNITYYSVVAH